MNANYKNANFDEIKGPYRKVNNNLIQILKASYDNVSKQYNEEKSNELGRIGMYITYCMAIDKLYIDH